MSSQKLLSCDSEVFSSLPVEERVEQQRISKAVDSLVLLLGAFDEQLVLHGLLVTCRLRPRQFFSTCVGIIHLAG